MEWTQLFTIALGAILVNNFIVAQFLGICPFMGVSKKIETASGMGPTSWSSPLWCSSSRCSSRRPCPPSMRPWVCTCP